MDNQKSLQTAQVKKMTRRCISLLLLGDAPGLRYRPGSQAGRAGRSHCSPGSPCARESCIPVWSFKPQGTIMLGIIFPSSLAPFLDSSTLKSQHSLLPRPSNSFYISTASASGKRTSFLTTGRYGAAYLGSSSRPSPKIGAFVS